MSQENVERYRQILDAWNRGDVDAIVRASASTVEIFTALAGVEGNYRGHEGVRRWWRDFHDVFPDWHAEPVEIRAAGDATLAQLRLTGHGGESGAPINELMWHVVHWHDGKSVRISRHDSEAETLEAARSAD